MKNRFILFFALVIISTASLSAFADEKLTAEEVISKHLDSISSKENLEKIVNQVILCDLQLTVKGSPTIIQGKSVIASEDKKVVWGMNLNSNDYPLDKYSFNGKDAKVSFVTPGTRSILGEFIFNNKELLQEGLLGGVLSNAWVLFNLENKTSKFTFEGEKKIENKAAYILAYKPQTRSNLEVKLYFDKQTFQHLRTDYSLIISASQAVVGRTSESQSALRGLSGAGNSSEDRMNASAGQGSERYRITEDFSNFQKVNGLTLPKSYKIYYSYFNDTASQSAQKRNREIEWKFNVTNAAFNTELDPASFDIDAK